MNATPSVFDYETTADFLRAVMESRRSRNRRYSQRSFASALGLSLSMTGYLLKGQRALSRDSAAAVAKRLGLAGPATEDYFILLTELDGVRSTSERERLRTKLRKFRKRAPPRPWPMEYFNLALHPHALSVLEACALAPVDAAASATLARKLALPKREVEELLSAHLAAGLVARDGSGRYVRVRGEVFIPPTLPLRKSDDRYRHTFAQASQALESATLDERVYAASYLPIRKDLLPTFRRKIYELLDELHDSVDDQPAPDAVYGLAIGFFKVLETGESNGSIREN